MIQAALVKSFIDDQPVLRGGCDERAMDGVAPELDPGWVHRRINACSGVLHADDSPYKPTCKSDKQAVRMTQRASVVLPSTGLPDPIRALCHPWRACHETSALCLNH